VSIVVDSRALSLSFLHVGYQVGEARKIPALSMARLTMTLLLRPERSPPELITHN
jgi:hypothetical protein